MRPAAATAVALSAFLSTALGVSLSLPVNLHLDLETSLLSLKLDPTVDPSVNLTDLVNLGKINILSSPVDTSSSQDGDGDSVTRGGRRMRAKRTLLGLDLTPEDASTSGTAISLSDLLDLSKINVLSAPVDTHSEQNGDGDTVTRGGRRAKRSLLNLDLSPDISPTISLSDLLDLSKLNILSSPVDTSSVQNGDNDSVVRGGRKRSPASILGLDLSSLLNLNKINILSAPVDTHSVQNGDDDSVVRGGRKRGLQFSPHLDLSDVVDASTINILSAPVDTHSVQNGNDDSVVRGGRMIKLRKAKRHPSLLNLNLSPDVSPDINLADLLDLDTINVLSSPVDTSSVQNGDGDTVTRGGRK